MSVQEIKNSFWRVPLIALVAGWLYNTCFVRIVIRFYVKEPERIDDVAIWTSGLLLVAILVVGWAILLRKQTRMEVFISSSIVVVYGLLLSAIQSLFGNMTDSVAEVLLLLNTPLGLDGISIQSWILFIETLCSFNPIYWIAALFYTLAVYIIWSKRFKGFRSRLNSSLADS